MRKRICSYIWAVLFVLSMTMFTTGMTVNAASLKAVKTVTVRADKKNVTKKTYTLEIGKSKSLKVTASPKRAVKSIRYKSNKPKVVAVNNKGKVTAKKKGTAKIQITVTGKNNKKKSTWVKVKAVNPAIKSVSVLIDNRNVTGKTYSLERGGLKDIKVNVTPARAVKSISYASNNTQAVNVDQKGTVIARNAGTARITVTATNKDNRKTSAWVDIKVTESKPNPQPTPTPTPTPTPGGNKILIAYFSATNTTEKIAGYIADELPADLYEIVPEVPYTAADLNYGDSTSRTSIEMNNPNARPAISGSIENMEQYETVFLGYPIWAVDMPQAIESFIKAYNLEGKTIIPFCTHGGSGQSGTYKKIQKLCSGADTLPGFAVSDEKVKTKSTQKKLKAWLKKIDVKGRSAKAVPITIKIGNKTFDGVCYNTELGKQMMKKFPLTVTMDEFGDREYYGDVAKKDRPTKKSEGKLAFVNGDITYCFENDTMAIFYNQSDNPDLTMRVNCIGRVTSSLSSFKNMGDSVKVTFDLKK